MCLRVGVDLLDLQQLKLRSQPEGSECTSPGKPGSTSPCSPWSCSTAIPARGAREAGNTTRVYHPDVFRHLMRLSDAWRCPLWCTRRLQCPFLDPESLAPALIPVACDHRLPQPLGLGLPCAWTTRVLRRLAMPLQFQHECKCSESPSGVCTIRVNPSTSRCLAMPGRLAILPEK